MIKLLCLLLLATVLAAQSQKQTQRELSGGGGNAERRMDLFCVLIVIAFSLFAGLRTSYNDTAAYIRGFQAAPPPAEFLANSENWKILHNPGFYLFQSVLRSWTDNAQLFVMLVSVFIECSMVRFLKRESEDFAVSVYLFITLGTFVFTMAAMKQVLAMAILTYAFPALREKKWLKYYLIVFLAMLFHTYAIVFAVLPLFRARPWSLFTYLFILALVLVMLNFETVISGFLDFADEQGKQIAEYEVFDDHGMNIFRVLVYAVIPTISFLFQRRLFSDSTVRENLLVHMSIVSLAFMILGTAAGANMFGRMANYFELGTICCFPWMMDRLFDRRSYRLICGIAAVCYLGFFVYANWISTSFDAAYRAVSLWQFLRDLV